MRFRLGRQLGRGKLAARQRAILDELARGEISADEAEARLGGSVRQWRLALGDPPGTEAEPTPAPAREESEEETAARELVERLARDVYGDPRS